ncbi:hypothetical protein KKP90_00305 [Methanothermococcus sp. SCGC AD-155-E23]|nr:hypothetical protein [Methanothermococcus sp. SCGC AD-155-E23]
MKVDNLHLIKIGGSLAQDVKPLLNTLKSISGKDNRIVVVPGGGMFAEAVRDLDREARLSNRASHRMALMAMDMMGVYLSDVSHIRTVDTLYDAKAALLQGGIVVLLPSNVILSTDELPHSWEVTSDSIALYIAKLLKLKRVIIATDVDGIYDRYPGGKLLNTISAKSLRGFTSVDSYLPKLSMRYGIECIVVNGRYPERVVNALRGREDIYTKIRVD